MKALRTVPIAGLAILLLASAAAGQSSPDKSEPQTPNPEAVKAISRLRSPFCPGLMLEVCPSPQAAVLRDSIETLARGGMSADSIVEWMLSEYGEEWRAMPRAQGRGLLAWLVPPGVLAIGLVGVGLALRTFRARARAREGTLTPEISAEERARVERALREMEEAESEDALL